MRVRPNVIESGYETLSKQLADCRALNRKLALELGQTQQRNDALHDIAQAAERFVAHWMSTPSWHVGSTKGQELVSQLKAALAALGKPDSSV